MDLCHIVLFVSCCLLSPAWKGLTSWVSCYLVFVSYPCGGLGQVWYLIVSIPDICLRPYLKNRTISM